MALLRLILIVLLVYLVLRFIGRLLFPWLYISTNQDRDYNRSQTKESRKKEGDVSVEDTGRDRGKIIPKDEGEYIDYEEIK